MTEGAILKFLNNNNKLVLFHNFLVMDNNPFVSVIITTKNEEKNIENCLNSILGQTYPKDKIEIILVDNGSTDKTKTIAKKFTDKIYDKSPERSAQRNYGVRQSSGEYFLYLDADMVIDKNVIRECAELVKTNSAIIGLYIPEIIMGESFWCQVRRFERSFYNGTVIDCVRFIKKDKFLETGGFDETMSGPEDWDLDRKIRQIGKVALISSPVHHNESEFSLKKYLSKKEYYIKSFDKYIAKWGANDPEIKKQLGFYYRFIGVFTENGKWKKLLMHPILTLEMFFLKFSVGIKYIARKK